MATWDQIAAAIQAQLTTASGLSSGSVIWKYQNAGAPALPYMALALGGIIEIGQGFVSESTNLARPAGQEIELKVGGQREVTLAVEVFTSPTVPTGTAAMAIADKARTALRAPTIRAALRAVGFVPFDPGPVQYAPDVADVGFRGRATCSIRCSMPAQNVVEYVGYIARVSGTATVHGGVVDPITEPFDFTIP